MKEASKREESIDHQSVILLNSLKDKTKIRINRKNILEGDNLSILRRHIFDEFVDLIYHDPPFNLQSIYNALLKEKSG
jgi:16S rRNA G966 N2-methylase RsmD